MNTKHTATHTKKKSLLPFIIILAGAVFLGFVVFAIIQRSNASTVNIERIFPVVIEVATPETLVDYFRINGDVMAENSANIFPDVSSGRLVRYTVDLGDNVTNNQILGWIDPSTPGTQYALNPIRATLNGTVSSLPIELGNRVTSSTVVAQVGDLTRLRIETHIPERFMTRVELGSAVEVTLPSYPDRSFAAYVHELAPVVDPISRTILTRINFRQSPLQLRAGMFAELKISTYYHENVLTVPNSAIIRRSSDAFAFIAVGERILPITESSAMDAKMWAKMVPITVGLSIDGRTMVTSGISEGDKVVVAGQSVLSEGSAVFVNEHSAIGNPTASHADASNAENATPMQSS
jgi:membrane fusion protein (multidrug efflux system)